MVGCCFVAYYGNENIRNAGCTYITERRELVAVHVIEQENAAPEYLPL